MGSAGTQRPAPRPDGCVEDRRATVPFPPSGQVATPLGPTFWLESESALQSSMEPLKVLASPSVGKGRGWAELTAQDADSTRRDPRALQPAHLGARLTLTGSDPGTRVPAAVGFHGQAGLPGCAKQLGSRPHQQVLQALD